MPYTQNNITGLMELMKQVVYGAELPDGKLPIGLRKHIGSIYRYCQLYSEGYKYSPLIQFFFEQYQKHPIHQHEMDLDEHDPLHIALFKDFINAMRNDAMAVKLKKTVADWESKFIKTEKRLIAFEAELFERYARLMVVRLDFNYHRAKFTLAEINQIHQEAILRSENVQTVSLAEQDISKHKVIEGRVTLEEVQKDREHFFSNMKGKPSLFKHLVGYVWRIEFTKKAGYHMHVTLFFDGSHVKEHAYLAQEIGEYWKTTITNDRGYFENCNREQGRYKDRWALGEINYWDSAKRSNLKNMLNYFCKTNQVVQIIPYAGCHLFGSGFVHRKRKVQGGRPRSRAICGTDHRCV